MAIFPALSSENAKLPSFDGFTRAAAATLVYTLFVILFGAVVRITGSGAGCGQHWPTCHGEIAHLPKTLETAIEFTHRVTSGLSLLAVVALVVLAIRAFPAGHPARRATYFALAMMVVEALIGARLVLLGLVGANASVDRAVIMPAHLVSTYTLSAALVLALWYGRPPPQVPKIGAIPRAPAPHTRLSLALTALALVVVSAAGAITALGDTLYPPVAGDVSGRVAEDHGDAATFLQRLRVVHPVLAVLASLWLFRLATFLKARFDARSVRRCAAAVMLFTGVQLAAGTLNVLLSAPGWLQVVHLALALGVWLSFVLLAAEVLELERRHVSGINGSNS